jgi:hypothetical protein
LGSRGPEKPLPEGRRNLENIYADKQHKRVFSTSGVNNVGKGTERLSFAISSPVAVHSVRQAKLYSLMPRVILPWDSQQAGSVHCNLEATKVSLPMFFHSPY